MRITEKYIDLEKTKYFRSGNLKKRAKDDNTSIAGEKYGIS